MDLAFFAELGNWLDTGIVWGAGLIPAFFLASQDSPQVLQVAAQDCIFAIFAEHPRAIPSHSRRPDGIRDFGTCDTLVHPE